MLVEDAISAFLLHCESVRRSAHTLAAYAQDLREYAKHAGSKARLERISGRDLERYHQFLRSRGLAPATIKRRLACLRSLFRWAVKARIRRRSPFAEVDLAIRLPDRLPRCLSNREAARLLRQRSRSGPLASLIIGLLVATGMRVGEIVALRTSDVDLDTGKLRILGKGDRQRTAFITDKGLIAEVRQAVGKRGGEERALLRDRHGALTTRRVRRLVKRVAFKAGISRNVTPHMLRHTAATMLIERRTDIRFVQRLLGHRSITTTQIYTNVTDQALRKAVARANVLSS